MKFFTQIQFGPSIDVSIDRIKAAITTHKVVHLSGYNLDMPMHEFYTLLSDSVGEIFNEDEDLLTGERKENRWIDISFDPEIPDRYRSSNTRQPLHTDDSYVELGDQKSLQFFYCQSRAAKGGATTFFDLDELVECLQIDGEHQLLEDLLSIEVNFEKAGNKKTRKILDKDGMGYLSNWNYYCIDEDNTPAAKKLVEDFHHYLESRIVPSGLITPAMLQKGDCAFFHDDRVLHGRNAYFAREKGERCLIKGKVILEPDYFLS